MRVGFFEVRGVVTGRFRLDGGAMFGNAPKAMWTRWATVDDGNRIDLACRALLASPLNGKTVLFETGIGAFFEPKLRERYGVQEPQHLDHGIVRLGAGVGEEHLAHRRGNLADEQVR